MTLNVRDRLQILREEEEFWEPVDRWMGNLRVLVNPGAEFANEEQARIFLNELMRAFRTVGSQGGRAIGDIDKIPYAAYLNNIET